MDKEQAKTIMLNIMLDLLYIDSEIDMREVGPILEKHLGLDSDDIKEVMNRFNGELRERYINHPQLANSPLGRLLSQKF